VEISPNESENHCCIILDDGIGSGGTIASLLDEAIRTYVKAVAVLVIFDRIGLQPRKHLHNVKQYGFKEKNILFKFDSYLEVNLRTFFRSNCPACRILGVIDEIQTSPGITSQSLRMLREILTAVPITSGKSHLPLLLSSEETAELISALDGLYSDLASPRQISMVLAAKNRRPAVRLILATAILSDRKLYRQCIDLSVVEHLIIDCFFNTKTTSAHRAMFMAESINWFDQKYALNILTNLLPQVYADMLQSRIDLSFGLDSHFDQAPEEFGALLLTMHKLIPKGELRSNPPLEQWYNLFVARERNTPSANIYLLELRKTLQLIENNPWDVTMFLLANFNGSYGKRHPESIRQRLDFFKMYIKLGAYNKAIHTFQKPIFESFLSGVRIVQDAISSKNIFEISDFEKLMELYEGLSEPDARVKMLDLLEEFFISSSPLTEPARIDLLLEFAAPTVISIITNGILAFKNRVPATITDIVLFIDEEALGQFRNVRILGAADILERTLEHLARNPVEHRCGKRFEGSPGDLHISLALRVCAERSDFIEIVVTDNIVEMTNDDLRLSFLKGGGLGAQRFILEQFGGGLLAAKVQNGRNEYVIRVRQLLIDPE
jgi:hypothetical protein